MYNNLSSIAYIGLGSNLGDRSNMIFRALDMIDDSPHTAVSLVSQLIETKPVGGPSGQGDFLNAAAELRTDLLPMQTLQLLLDTERKLGRERHERWGPRCIDLDLLLFNHEVIQRAELIVPHPRLHERLFVLQPLAEIAPDAIHPLLNRTVGELWRNLVGGAP